MDRWTSDWDLLQWAFGSIILLMVALCIPACANETTVSGQSMWALPQADVTDSDQGSAADEDSQDVLVGDVDDPSTDDLQISDSRPDDISPDDDEGMQWVLVDSGPDQWPTEPDDEPGSFTPFTFIIHGDNQFATNSCTSGIPERAAVPYAIRDMNPDFVLHVGDLVDHAYEEGAYDNFVFCTQEILDHYLFFPTMGNHDAGGGGVTIYKAFLEWQLFEQNPSVYLGEYGLDFPLWYEDDLTEWSTDRDNPSDRDLLPSGVTFKTYYAFRHQNAYFISFEQGTRWWTQTPKPWLEQHLGVAYADPTIDYIFVYMHHPMYSTIMPDTDSGECIEPVRSEYEALFRQYDVTVVFSGHVHSYDRFYVPDDGTPTRQSPPPESYPHDGEGIHYIVTGGGGGGLTNGCDPFPLRQDLSYDYSQARGCFHHVTQVEVNQSAITVSIIRVTGGVADYVTTVEDLFWIE